MIERHNYPMRSENSIIILSRMTDRADTHAGLPGHCVRVAVYVDFLLQALGIAGSAARTIRDAARVHDIGRLAWSSNPHLTSGSLSEDDWRLIRTHPRTGADWLADWRATAEICSLVLHHHERYDGRGYPDGLRGEEIPFGSRVIAVADGFEALTHHRPHRLGFHVDHALAILAQEAGQQWDAGVVEAFVREAYPALSRSGRLMISPDLMRPVNMLAPQGEATA